VNDWLISAALLRAMAAAIAWRGHGSSASAVKESSADPLFTPPAHDEEQSGN
jgi:hypothetical protein